MRGRIYGRSIHNISSSQDQKKEKTRISFKDEDKRRPEDSEKKKGKGPQKIDRLRRGKDFRKIFSAGRKINTRYFILYLLPNNLKTVRLGLAVSRKIGNAVVRNRVKRILREAMRSAFDLVLKEEKPPKVYGYDIVLIPGQRCIRARSSDIAPDLTGKLKTVTDEKTAHFMHKDL